jgi:hypothetical protein
MQSQINKYFPNLTINEITANKSQDELYGATITVRYTINEGTFITTDTITQTF